MIDTCADCRRTMAVKTSQKHSASLCSGCSTWRDRESCIRCSRELRVQQRTSEGPLCVGCALHERRSREATQHRVQIVEIVAAADSALDRSVVARLVDNVARTSRDALALERALSDRPALLVEPTLWAPRLVSELMRAVAAAGSLRVTAPRCSQCGSLSARARLSDDPRRLCEYCKKKLTPQPCATCREVRPRWRRAPTGGWQCDQCWYRKRRDAMSAEERERRRRARRTYPTCAICGRPTGLSRNPDCAPCSLDRAWSECGAQSSMLLQELQIALGPAGSRFVVLRACPLITALGTDPPSHEMLDRGPDAEVSESAVNMIRRALVDLRELPPRDEVGARLARWVRRHIDAADVGVDRANVLRFAHWWVIRRDSARPRRGPGTARSRQHVRAAVTFVLWLQREGLSLATCSESDLDRWIATTHPRSATNAARPFARWAVREGIASDLDIRRHAEAMPTTTVDVETQRHIVQSLLNDENIAAGLRLGGLFVGLYAQPVTRISLMPRSAVTSASGTDITVNFGGDPVVLPEPVAAVARTHLAETDDRQSAWLFPTRWSVDAPLSPGRFCTNLRAIGVNRALRAATLFELARELPAPVLRDVLGIHGNTAARWTAAAGGSWNSYVTLPPPTSGT